jgi:two-component system nitrate/nitrite response regulator NarL
MNRIIRISLADDHALFTEGVAALLQADDELEVGTVYHDGATLLEGIDRDDCDILLLDVRLGMPDGLAVLEAIAKMGLQIKVIMLSTHSETDIMIEARRLGARGYLLKQSNHSELKQAILKVMQGDTAFELLTLGPQSAEDKFRRLRETYGLTRREWEILLHIKQQHTNQMISEALHLSIFTVETHRKNLMQKLKLRTAVALHQFIRLYEL